MLVYAAAAENTTATKDTVTPSMRAARTIEPTANLPPSANAPASPRISSDMNECAHIENVRGATRDSRVMGHHEQRGASFAWDTE